MGSSLLWCETEDGYQGGMINWAAMGDPNASLPTPQPVFYRPMFGAMGKTLQDTCVTFVSQAALDDGVKAGLDRQVIAVKTAARSPNVIWCVMTKHQTLKWILKPLQ